MGWLKLQYFLLVFIASCGLLQGVFAYRRIAGLLFFPSRWAGYVVSVLAVAGAFAWFFATGDRNQPPIIEGSQQTGMFFAGSAAAVVFTLAVSSITNCLRPAGRSKPGNPGGLDDLRDATYVRCLPRMASELWEAVRGLGRWWK